MSFVISYIYTVIIIQQFFLKDSELAYYTQVDFHPNQGTTIRSPVTVDHEFVSHTRQYHLDPHDWKVQVILSLAMEGNRIGAQYFPTHSFNISLLKAVFGAPGMKMFTEQKSFWG